MNLDDDNKLFCWYSIFYLFKTFRTCLNLWKYIVIYLNKSHGYTFCDTTATFLYINYLTCHIGTRDLVSLRDVDIREEEAKGIANTEQTQTEVPYIKKEVEYVDKEATALTKVLYEKKETKVVDKEEHAQTLVSFTKEEAVEVDEGEQTRIKVTYNIVFITAEAAPYSKTGGLGDVCGSLPIALAGRGHRVMVLSPRYLNGTLNSHYASAKDLEKHINVSCFGGDQEVAFFHEYRAGVDWVLF